MTSVIRVLYVDDEPSLLDIGKIFLEESGDFAVTTAISADEGIRLLEQEKFDAIISDYQMPVMDGIQFLVEVRSRFGPIPFILFTGRGREEVVIQAINSGADFYLQKGGEPGAQFAELSHKIKAAASSKRADDLLRKSEEKYRQLVELAQEGIWAIDANGYTTYVNRLMAEMLGYSVEEMLGAHLFSFMDDAGKTIAAEKMERRRQGIKEEHEFEFITKQGTHIYAALSTGPITDDKGIYMGALAVVSDITERKQMDETYHKRDLQIRNLFENIPIGMFQATSEGKIVFVNSATATMLGYDSPEDLIESVNKTSIADVLYEDPETRPGFVRDVQQNRGKWKIFENRYRKKDGTIIDTVISFSLYTDPITGIENQYGFVQDITERKVAEEQLKESEERYRSLYVDSRDAIMLVSPERGFIAANPAALQLFALRDEKDFIACSPASLSPDYQPDGVLSTTKSQEMMHLALEKGSNFFEWTHRKSDGTEFPAMILLSRLESGGTQLLQATVRDITERKMAEVALKESEERFKSYIDNSPEGVFIADERGCYLEVNPGACRITGYEKEELLAMQISDILPPESTEAGLKHFKELIEYGHAFGELLFRHKDGSLRYWTVDAVRLTPTRFIGFVKDITERKVAEEALKAAEREVRQSKDRFRAFLDHSYDAVFIHDTQGKVLDVNATTLRLYHVTYEEALRYTIADYSGPANTIDEAHEHWARALAGEDQLFFWQARRPNDGTVFDVEVYLTSITLDDRQIILGNIRDITERKRIEEALQLKDFAILSSINAIAIADLSGNLTYVNPAFLSIWGYEDLKEVLWRPVLSFWKVPDEAQQVVDTIQVKGIWSGEMTGQRKDGTPVQVQLSANLVLDASKTPVAMMASFIDITERKRAEKELCESEERYSSLFSHNYSVSLLIDPDTGRIVDANAAACRYYGYSEEQLVGMGIYEINRQDKDKVIQNLMRAKNERHFFSTHFLADGKKRNVEVYSGPIIVNGKSLFYSIIHDVTDKVKAEDASRETNKKLNLLSSITRHDINNQLLTLNGFLEILHRKVPDPTLEEFFSKMKKASERIAAMIRFTREYECIGVKAPSWQDCRTLADTAAKQAPLGQVIMKNDLPDGQEVFADPLIVKVFYNLMDNAVRYGGQITTIRFSLEDRDGVLFIVCEDDGDGVVVEEKEKIFERGYGKNTGMGLFLAREILDITGITIRENGEPGKGARFEMTVPKGAWRMKGNGA